jgi:hypothetical protein
VLRCAEDGSEWEVDDVCTQEEYCDEANPTCVTRVCDPLEVRCSEGSVVQCNEVGSAEELVQDCGLLGQSCQNNACSDACPLATGRAQAGPAMLYGFCFYLGQDGEVCDNVCADVGGENLYYEAEDAWLDACSAPSMQDVVRWFYDNGNPGAWSGPGGTTSGRALGYGYRNSSFYGKCAAGTVTDVGTLPGDTNGTSTRALVCPCF